MEGENTKNKVFSTLFWQMIFGISRLSTEVVSSIYEISIDVQMFLLIDWRVNGLERGILPHAVTGAFLNLYSTGELYDTKVTVINTKHVFNQ